MLKTLRVVAPRASFHALQENKGYGGANNVVVRKIHSTYHLIMNPDVTFEPDLIKRMAAYMDAHPDIAILTPRLFYPDGTEQFVPRMQPTLRRMAGSTLEKRFGPAAAWRDEYTLRKLEPEGPMQVEMASGSFLFIRTHVLFRLQGFDERFFLYMEDADLSRRALKYGRIVYNPDFCVTHLWRRDSAHHLSARLQHLRSAWQYYHKWGWVW